MQSKFVTTYYVPTEIGILNAQFIKSSFLNSRVKINLVCVERVSYTKGTTRVTDVAVVYENMIYSGNLLSGDREVIAHFDLEIPLSYSSSFEGKYNQIRWVLDVEEIYPGLLEQKHTYLTFVVDP